MSYWIIKSGGNMLSDFRPQIECPQWYYERARAYKFKTAAEAWAFWREKRKSYELNHQVRFVRVMTKADARARLTKLRAAIEEAHRNLPMNPAHAQNVLGAALAITPWPLQRLGKDGGA